MLTHTHKDRQRQGSSKSTTANKPERTCKSAEKHFKKTNSIQGNTKQGEEDCSTSPTQEHKRSDNILSTPYHNVIMIDFLYTPAQSIPIWAIVL